MPIPGRSDYRELVLRTRLVPFTVVRGQMAPRDGAIELYDIEVDLDGLMDPEEDPESGVVDQTEGMRTPWPELG